MPTPAPHPRDDTASTGSPDAVDRAVALVRAAEPRCGTTVVVAVDGPSGAGKSTFADALAARLDGPQVVHMDDLYPGWDGLGQAVPRLHDQVLAPLARGERAAYQRYDWDRGAYAEWHEVPAAPVLVLEGVACGARPCAPYLSALVWVEAAPGVRFTRGMDRDGDAYRPHWERWARQEEAHFAADGTRGRADLLVETNPPRAGA